MIRYFASIWDPETTWLNTYGIEATGPDVRPRNHHACNHHACNHHQHPTTTHAEPNPGARPLHFAPSANRDATSTRLAKPRDGLALARMRVATARGHMPTRVHLPQPPHTASASASIRLRRLSGVRVCVADGSDRDNHRLTRPGSHQEARRLHVASAALCRSIRRARLARVQDRAEQLRQVAVSATRLTPVPAACATRLCHVSTPLL